MEDSHRTSYPTTLSNSGVVSCEIIKISMTYTSLMGLDAMKADISNACLQAPTSEKYHVICGPEFGLEFFEKVALIT